MVAVVPQLAAVVAPALLPHRAGRSQAAGVNATVTAAIAIIVMAALASIQATWETIMMTTATIITHMVMTMMSFAIIAAGISAVSAARPSVLNLTDDSLCQRHARRRCAAPLRGDAAMTENGNQASDSDH